MPGRAVALLLLAGLLAASAEAASPRLVVLLAVDQLRRDRLDPALPGGLGRLAREGRVFRRGVLDHATTETCPGHASMVTGRHPGRAGIPGNRFVERDTGTVRYCVEDPARDAAVIGGSREPEAGRSPRSLRVDTLGDWMKQADPGSRVFAVSAKDRSAVVLGGHGADAAYWLLREGAPAFTTSRYYAEALPDWVEAFNRGDGGGLASRVPSEWVHATEPEDGRADDFPGESAERSRTSPHPLHAWSDADFGDNLYASPYVDRLTLAFAERLVEQEGLGGGGAPDLLAVSLSGTDAVGHAYGPGSLEARDALRQLDAALGETLDRLVARTGPGGLVVALTSDHGVLALPEWLDGAGELECPVPGGRQGLVSLVVRLQAALHFELSPFSWPRPWLRLSSQLTVDRALAAGRGVPVERVVEAAERWVEAQPAIREAWTRAEILEGDGEMAALYRNAYDPERSGDLAIQVEPTCLIDFDGAGTGHGSPYAYDRDVPIVFWGADVPGSVSEAPARTVDVAPTLAGRIGLEPPPDLDGRDLLR